MLDPYIDPPPARIGFGGGYVFPILDPASKDMACNRVAKPAPGAVAEVRAGSSVTFHWSQWLYSHKGPITAWMAPYEGDISDVDVKELEFFKIAEDTFDDRGVWANVRMMDDTNMTWTAEIPADIKPGNYVLRHEVFFRVPLPQDRFVVWFADLREQIIALHFVLGHRPGFEFVPIGPQFYMSCFNVRVTEGGEARPRGVKFPGAYHRDDPGLHWNVSAPPSVTGPYPSLGLPVHKSAYTVSLPPRELVVVSPTGNSDTDTQYFAAQNAALERLGALISFIVSRGG